MEKIYFAILKKIEKMDYNVYKEIARISKIKKLYYAMGVYVKYNFAYR
jgi:hypothetical protein